jgi:DNA-binding protein HU-beta
VQKNVSLFNLNKIKIMTKAEVVNEISNKTGFDKSNVQDVVEAFMKSVKNAMESGENVYLRSFGSFIVKERAEKTARNISKKTTIVIPAHKVPVFKPCKTFVNQVKQSK